MYQKNLSFHIKGKNTGIYISLLFPSPLFLSLSVYTCTLYHYGTTTTAMVEEMGSIRSLHDLHSFGPLALVVSIKRTGPYDATNNTENE